VRLKPHSRKKPPEGRIRREVKSLNNVVLIKSNPKAHKYQILEQAETLQVGLEKASTANPRPKNSSSSSLSSITAKTLINTSRKK
jgi:hypothetical protein